MAQDRDNEVIAGLRTATAETRSEISTTVNAIEQRLSTVAEGLLPARALVRRLDGHAGSSSWITTLAVLGAGVGLWIWLRPGRPQTLL